MFGSARQEDCFAFRVKHLIVPSNGLLIFHIGTSADSPHQELRSHTLHKINRQAVKAIHLHVRNSLDRRFDNFDSSRFGQQIFLGSIHRQKHIKFVKQRRSALYDIEVTQGERIERPCKYGDFLHDYNLEK